jgi:long-subunit acyl-CoA synthetase (AMP-forming)
MAVGRQARPALCYNSLSGEGIRDLAKLDWAETEKEIEALALGLLNLGVNEGDFIAVIGRNRPYLYWSMVAAQSVGAMPVPLYQDAVAEEMAYVWTIAARASPSSRIRSRSTRSSTSRTAALSSST